MRVVGTQFGRVLHRQTGVGQAIKASSDEYALEKPPVRTRLS
jgi:hypothetical protein